MTFLPVVLLCAIATTGPPCEVLHLTRHPDSTLTACRDQLESMIEMWMANNRALPGTYIIRGACLTELFWQPWTAPLAPRKDLPL